MFQTRTEDILSSCHFFKELFEHLDVVIMLELVLGKEDVYLNEHPASEIQTERVPTVITETK